MSKTSHLIDLLKEKSLEGVLNKYVSVDDENDMKRFISAISSVDLNNVSILRYLLRTNSGGVKINNFDPVPYHTIDTYKDAKEFSRLGLDMIRQGKVAFLIFSGGAATRLKEQFGELREICLSRF